MTETKKIRTVIVDDEELARDRIQTLLELQPDVEVVGVCTDGPSAVEMIDRTQPDLVFLDVQMPGLDGFHVLEALDVARLPAIVFVSGFDEYALHTTRTPCARSRFTRSTSYSSRSIKHASRKRWSGRAAT
jgi:YesN/AraC family two-component response regulator